LYGKVGPKGLFEGNNNAYIYCDMSTVLKGKFVNGKMVNAVPTKIKEVYFEKCRAILRLKFCKPKYKAQEYQYWPSTLDEVGVPPYLEDPYESQLVFGCMSDCHGAGDGLFLKKNVKANTTVAFYNGIRVRPGEKAAFANSGYQIFVDWNKRSEVTSDYMDIPPEYVSLNRYTASLGHKINHSFDPNCRWGTVEHPTFGRVPRVVTIKDLKAGTELTCHYMIDMEEAVECYDHLKWYVDLWDEFSKNANERNLNDCDSESNSSGSLA